ncbi:MAG: hypothetical protein SF069_11685 [Phycisphaerae bacterium]|nr:hypothetical protein [Phycisphaerae bacterium]
MGDWKKRYESAREALLADNRICAANRGLFTEFLAYEEYKLKRTNSVSVLDTHSYCTLWNYTTRLRSVNRWFGNKPWKELTRADIQNVYDGLEDGTITSARGELVKERETFYSRIMRGKPFELAGKAAIAREVMQFSRPNTNRDVRFISEETFRSIVEVMLRPEQRLLAWLCFDIGENATAILSLRKRDCVRQSEPGASEPEYRINLRRETLKRSRRPRSELTNYRETVAYLDQVLPTLREDDLLFEFGAPQAAKVLRRAVKITGATCQPGGQVVTLKDLRSSMACDLLRKGWTTDEVNARLGHRPSSRELDKYVNFLALDRQRPKKKMHETQIGVLLDRLEAMQQREKLHTQRQERLSEELERLQKQVDEQNRRTYEDVRRLIEQRFSTKRRIG